MKQNFRTVLAAALLAASASWAMSVQAREPDHIAIGAGAAVSPAFQGSRDYRVRPLPMVDIRQGRFFASLRNGAGVAVLDSETLTVGTSVTYVPGYRRRDAPAGIDGVSTAAGVRIFATARTGGFVFDLGATKAVTGSARGLVADAAAGYPIGVSPRLILTPRLAVTWADRSYNDQYFGVTAREASASGLGLYSAGAGFKDASASLTAAYRLTDQVTVVASAGVTTLLGDGRDSPIVVRKTQPVGMLAASYRF